MIKPVPGLTIEQQPEPVVRRMVLYGEARNQEPIGQLAILNVIATLASEKSADQKTIILHPYRFSSLNAGDPNRALLLDAYAREPKTWAVIDTVCSLFESGFTIDPTHGANHYYNPKACDPQPKWGRGSPDWQETAIIGDHVFGRCP
jgi:spore germination cell wall hydrolase CwlJ-like protein